MNGDADTMMCLVSSRGPYLRAGDLCRQFHISPAMVTTIKHGIEALEGTRYAKACPFLNRGGDWFFNQLVVIDYLKYRDRLAERNLARTVPPYVPADVRYALGEYRTPVKDGSDEARRLDKICELLSLCNQRQQEIADTLRILINGRPTKKDLKAIADGVKKTGEDIQAAAGGMCAYLDDVGA